MTDTEWTKGPWSAHIHTGPLDGEAHVNADGACIAYVGFGTETERHYVTGEEAKANARLIAAAPDLYAALVAARRQCITLGGDPLPFRDVAPDAIQKAVIDTIDTALAKARGDQ